RRQVETSPLGAPFHRLIGSEHTSSFRKALRRILPIVYARQGVPESDPLFQANKGAFYGLRKEGFITPRLSPDRRELVWHLAGPMVDLLEEAYELHKIIPADALEAMFSDPVESLPHEAETIYGSVRR